MHFAITTAWVMAGTTLCVLAPQTAPVLIPLSVVSPLLWSLRAGTRAPIPRPTAVIATLLVANGFLMINASWSLSPWLAYRDASTLLVFTLALHVTIGTMPSSQVSAQRAMAIGFLGGVVLASSVLCLEAFTQQWGRRLLMSNVPWLLTAPRHMIVAEGRVIHLEPYLLNRNMTALVALFWPALLVAWYLGRTSRSRALLLFALLPAWAAILRSQHATSKMALLGAAAAYVVYWHSPRVARRLALTAWTAATLFVVPLALLAYASQLYLASWMPPSAQHRIIIWGYTGEQVAKSPILGAGASTARALHNPNDFDARRAPGSAFQLSTGLHSHNGYLQTWYETGAVGALLLFGLGLMVMRSVTSAPAEAQPALCATLVSCALLGASSFSLWAPWFMATFAFAAVFATLARELSANDNVVRIRNVPNG